MEGVNSFISTSMSGLILEHQGDFNYPSNQDITPYYFKYKTAFHNLIMLRMLVKFVIDTYITNLSWTYTFICTLNLLLDI